MKCHQIMLPKKGQKDLKKMQKAKEEINRSWYL